MVVQAVRRSSTRWSVCGFLMTDPPNLSRFISVFKYAIVDSNGQRGVFKNIDIAHIATRPDPKVVFHSQVKANEGKDLAEDKYMSDTSEDGTYYYLPRDYTLPTTGENYFLFYKIENGMRNFPSLMARPKVNEEDTKKLAWCAIGVAGREDDVKPKDFRVVGRTVSNRKGDKDSSNIKAIASNLHAVHGKSYTTEKKIKANSKPVAVWRKKSFDEPWVRLSGEKLTLKNNIFYLFLYPPFDGKTAERNDVAYGFHIDTPLVLSLRPTVRLYPLGLLLPTRNSTI